MRAFLGATLLCVAGFSGVSVAAPVEPTSYQVTTDSTTAYFQLTFDRAFDPTVGDEFQIWTTDGTAAYDDVVERMTATGVEHSNFMESQIAAARLFSDTAPEVSMVRFIQPAAAAGLAQIVDIVPFFPGTQDNGHTDNGGWGALLGNVNYVSFGSQVSVAVPLSLLGMSGSFTYFFETFQQGASSVDDTGLVAQWLGKTNVNYLEPFAVPAITPIPEPGTYALMLAGLAAVGFVASRRSEVAGRG